MVGQEQIKEAEVVKEQTFNVTFTKSELALIVNGLAEDKDLQTFISYHRGESKYTIFKELKAVLDTQPE